MRPRAPRKLRARHERGELRAVVDEAVAFFHRLRWVGSQIYGEEGRSEAQRGLLRGLVHYGAQTVPAMARARAVSRQNVQHVVDELARRRLVELVENPAHARSRLVRATARGASLVARWAEIDRRVLAAAGAGVGRADLETTATTLRVIRERFEHQMRWRRALPPLASEEPRKVSDRD